MNNYDYFYNGSMINSQLLNSTFIRINQLKWMTYFLIGFIFFQIVFFTGFSYFSIIIELFLFYVTYLFITNLSEDYEIEILTKKLLPINLILTVCIICSFIDLLYSTLVMNEYLKELLKSNNFYQRNFGWFTIYVLLFRIYYLIFLRIFNGKLCEIVE